MGEKSIKRCIFSLVLICFIITMICSTSVAESGLKVVDWNWKRGAYGNKFLSGTLKNYSRKQYSYVQIVFNLYDDHDALVGNAMANVNNLEPNGSWNFKAIVIEDKATKARLTDVTGF